MHCGQQVASRERLGDYLLNSKGFGGGARSAEPRPELPGYRDQRRLWVSGPDGAQAPCAFMARHIYIDNHKIGIIRRVDVVRYCRAYRVPGRVQPFHEESSHELVFLDDDNA